MIAENTGNNLHSESSVGNFPAVDMSTKMVTADIKSLLMECHESDSMVYHRVIVTTPSCNMLLIETPEKYQGRSMADSTAITLDLSKAMHITTNTGVRPIIKFVDISAGTVLVGLRSEDKSKSFILTPCTWVGGILDTYTFINRVHAEAYIGEFIDQLIPGINWAKLKLTADSMIV